MVGIQIGIIADIVKVAVQVVQVSGAQKMGGPSKTSHDLKPCQYEAVVVTQKGTHTERVQSRRPAPNVLA